jgi:hypothetical protein
MVDSVWRGSRPFVRWAAICTQMAFYGTQVWQVAGAAYMGLTAWLAEWVSPVGGAPSRRTSTSACSWGTQARRKAMCHVASEQVVPRSRQPRHQAAETRRCQVAEEMRGPPSGRAQEGRRQPLDEVSGSHGAFAFEFRGSKFYFKNKSSESNGTYKCRGALSRGRSIDRERANSSL